MAILISSLALTLTTLSLGYLWHCKRIEQVKKEERKRVIETIVKHVL